MKVLRGLWQILQLIAHLLYGILLSYTVPRHPVGNGEQLPDPDLVCRWLGRFARVLNIELVVDGRIPQHASLVVANHVSWLDVPILGSLIHTGFLAKHEIRQWPLVGRLAQTAGTLFIRRGSGEAQQVAQLIGQRLDADLSLTIFPEGTTTHGDQVKPFFPRLFAAAIETATPVVPVALRYTVDDRLDRDAAWVGGQHPYHQLTGILGRPHSRLYIHFCDPIDPEGKERKALATEARDALIAALDAMPVQTDE